MSNNQKEPTHCVICGEPLIKIPMKGGFYLVCDNWRCKKYRERQYTGITEPDALAYLTKRGKYVFRERANLSDKNTRKREHYAYARRHGLPSVLAGAICGNSIRYIDGQIALHQLELSGAGRI